MELKDLRKQSVQDLGKTLSEQTQSLTTMRFQLVNSSLKDTTQIKKARRTIAKIKTVIREKELAQND
ncbi:MAG: 50S ribosomal protein L29 [bacterium]|nr:50S ribosomal protein L29 [bacterium]